MWKVFMESEFIKQREKLKQPLALGHLPDVGRKPTQWPREAWLGNTFPQWYLGIWGCDWPWTLSLKEFSLNWMTWVYTLLKRHWLVPTAHGQIASILQIGSFLCISCLPEHKLFLHIWIYKNDEFWSGTLTFILFSHLFRMYKWSWKGTVCRALLSSFLWITMCLSLCFTKIEKNNKIIQCCSMWQNTIQTTAVKTTPKLPLHLKYYLLQN